jgi:hypothetical protein
MTIPDFARSCRGLNAHHIRKRVESILYQNNQVKVAYSLMLLVETGFPILLNLISALNIFLILKFNDDHRISNGVVFRPLGGNTFSDLNVETALFDQKTTCSDMQHSI